MKTKVPILKDQEFFANYGYTMDFAPKWYRELYKQFVKDNPTKANEGWIKMIDNIDKMLEKGDIPMWQWYTRISAFRPKRKVFSFRLSVSAAEIKD